MDVKKQIRIYEFEYMLYTANQEQSSILQWLSNNYIVTEESKREWWMPLTQKFKYPDVSVKFANDYGAEEKEKLSAMQEKSYPLKIESHFNYKGQIDVCLLYLAEIVEQLKTSTLQNMFASKYKEFWVKNTHFLIEQTPIDKKLFIKDYLNYFVDRFISENRCMLNYVAIGSILNKNGLGSIKLH